MIRVQPHLPEPEPAVDHPPAPQPQLPPQPQADTETMLLAESEPVLELALDDLDTPAYLRQGRLLN